MMLHVIASPDALTIQASTDKYFWSTHQDDSAWSMVLEPVDGVRGRYLVEVDEAFFENENHPRFLYASRCISRLQKQFPRLTKHFTDDNRFFIQLHDDDLLLFRMYWEMID